MRFYAFPLALASLFCTPAAALVVEHVTEPELRRYSAALAVHATNFQWQQLWHSSRLQGYFSPTGPQLRFTLPMRDIPGLVRQTLADPDQVQVRSRTKTYLRRDFSPRTVGQARGHDLTAVCVLVDWRGAPDTFTPGPVKAHELTYVSLARTEPC